MLELICMIPESIAWTAVGVLGTVCAAMFGILIQTIATEIKERKAEEIEEEIEEQEI